LSLFRSYRVDNIATYIADGTPQETGARVDAVALDVEESGASSGFLFRFTADENTEAAWNGDVGYSIFDARLRISTITAQINGLEP
jgi:hypothetical protein